MDSYVYSGGKGGNGTKTTQILLLSNHNTYIQELPPSTKSNQKHTPAAMQLKLNVIPSEADMP